MQHTLATYYLLLRKYIILQVHLRYWIVLPYADTPVIVTAFGRFPSRECDYRFWGRPPPTTPPSFGACIQVRLYFNIRVTQEVSIRWGFTPPRSWCWRPQVTGPHTFGNVQSTWPTRVRQAEWPHQRTNWIPLRGKAKHLVRLYWLKRLWRLKNDISENEIHPLMCTTSTVLKFGTLRRP